MNRSVRQGWMIFSVSVLLTILELAGWKCGDGEFTALAFRSG
jgi:hypothetical protein